MIKLKIEEINDMNYKINYKSENTNVLEHIVAISKLISEIENSNYISRKEIFKYIKKAIKNCNFIACESEGKNGK